MPNCRAINLLLLAGVVGALSATTAGAQLKMAHASWERSSWQVEANSQQCALTHDIPRFGQARFEQSQGRRLQFAILADQPQAGGDPARAHSESPPWQHPVVRRALGEFPVQQGRTPLRLAEKQARRIYRELEQGMKPVFEFSDRSDGPGPVQVSLMPVRFRQALQEFQHCAAKLLYLDFEPVGEETVLFATNSDRLSLAARRVLEKIALDHRRQPNFRLVLGGHADERGDAAFNLDLSRRRAEAVAHYLRARGVPAAVIETRFFGATLPADPSRGADAWARNRRVTVWMAETSTDSEVPDNL